MPPPITHALKGLVYYQPEPGAPGGANGLFARGEHGYQAAIRVAGPFFTRLTALYQQLTSEQTIWFWITTCIVVVALITAVILLVRGVLRVTNAFLQNRNGWKPIRIENVGWAAATTWLYFIAYRLHSSSATGWTIVLALAVLSTLALVVYLVRRISAVKGLLAFFCNGTLGILVSPILYFFAIAALIVIVGALLLFAYAYQAERTVYVRRR